MKKILLLLLMTLSVGLSAQEMRFVDQADGTVKFSYRVKKNNYGGYDRIPNSYSGDIVIPSSYNGKTVSAIDELAFDECVDLTSVSMPNTIKLISEKAFSGCKKLTAVSIPASVDSIGPWAFDGCGLKRVTVEDGNKMLRPWRGGAWNGYTPFNGCPLETVYVGRNIESGRMPFRSYTTIKYLTFGDNVNRISNEDYYQCRGLRSVSLSPNITAIGEYAFSGCDTLSSITLPEAVTRIGKSAFGNCEVLSKVNIPSSLRVIEESVFGNCKKLTTISIPANVDSIGAWAFGDCGLTKVTLEDGDRVLKTWRGGAWNSYTPFNNCPIETLYVGRNFVEGTAPFMGYKTIKTLTLSDKVTSVLASEFSECRGLRSVSFSKNITDIGNNAFYHCDTLVSIKLPEGVKRIGSSAFAHCDTLSKANIPSTVRLICESAFNSCKKLTEIVIPASVDSIGAWAFSDGGLKRVTLKDGDKVLKTWRGGAWNSYTPFNNCPIETLYVGRNLLEGANPFKGFTTIKTLTLSDKVTSVLASEFNECRGLRSVSFGINITDIGDNAFHHCDTLRSISLPETVTRIGNAAFGSCDKLSKANIPSRVRLIGENAFSSCKNLTEIVIPASVDSIGPWAFYSSGLKKVTIKNGNTPLRTWRGGAWNGYTPFSDCPIETLYMGRNFVQGKTPFSGFNTITTLSVGSTVNHLYESEYNNCEALRQIYSYSVTPPVCDHTNVFRNVDKNACKLYVVAGRVESYKAAFVWEEFFHVEVTEDYQEESEPLPGDGTGTIYVYNPTNQTVTVTEVADKEPVVIACGPWDIPVKQVFIPRDIFSENHPKDVHIGTSTPPEVTGGNLNPNDVGGSTLHVPAGSEDVYKKHPEWGKFGKIVGDYGTTPSDEPEEITDPNGNVLKTDSETGETTLVKVVPDSNGNIEIGPKPGSNIPAVDIIQKGGFDDVGDLKDVTVNQTTPPDFEDPTELDNHNPGGGTLHVPVGTSEVYKNHPVWSKINKIVEDGAQPGGMEFVVHLKAGGTVGYALSTKPAVTLVGTVFTLTTTETTVTYQHEEVEKFTLNALAPVGIEEEAVLVEPQVQRQAGQLTFTGCKPNEVIRIYTVGGRLVLTARTDADGYAEVQTAQLPKGVYVVKSESVTIKIAKQ